MEAPVDPHERTGVEAPQVQLVDAELMVGFRACGEQHLETAVEEEAVDGLGPDSTTDRIGSFENLDVDPTVVQEPRAREPGKSPANHDHVDPSVGHHRRSWHHRQRELAPTGFEARLLRYGSRRSAPRSSVEQVREDGRLADVASLRGGEQREATVTSQRLQVVVCDETFGAPEFGAVSTDELVVATGVVSVPLPQLGRGRDLLAPLVETGPLLAEPTRPQPVDEHALTVVGLCDVVHPTHPY